MDKEGLKERKAYYEKLVGWSLTGFFALIGGLAGLIVSGLEGLRIFLFVAGLFASVVLLGAILRLHFSIMDIIKKMEEGDGR